VSADPVLGPVGRAIVRAEDTGAPVADSLQHLVDDLQRDRVIDTEDVARRVAVRSAVPMGLCFLPAFVLVGVTPTVVGAFSTLLG
jgi:pilus assembly protein TadC